MSDECISPPATSDNSLAPALSYIGVETRVKIDGGKIKLWDRKYYDYPVVESSLFGAVKLIKNTDIDKYKYSGYGIRFDRREKFSVPGGFGRNGLVFSVDMSSSVHIDHNGKDILMLGEGPTQGLDDITIIAEKKYSINFTENGKNFVQAWIIMEQIAIYLLIEEKSLNLMRKILRSSQLFYV